MEKMAHEGGAVGYIAKPFMLDRLARKIMATLRKESEGGTLHSVSSGIFLQLMEMEQKTCTIRLEDKSSGKKGVLFFRDGELLDARVDDLQAKPAAIKIFSWDKVTISIQNICPPIDNRVKSELQPLILEASRLKDEEDAPDEPQPEAAETKQVVKEMPAAKSRPPDTISKIKKKLQNEIGQRSGLEDIYKDDSWRDLLRQLAATGNFLKAGKLKLCYIDRGEPFDYILLPGREITVLTVSPKCPRDKIIQVLYK
jgi:hypothetical protein